MPRKQYFLGGVIVGTVNLKRVLARHECEPLGSGVPEYIPPQGGGFYPGRMVAKPPLALHETPYYDTRIRLCDCATILRESRSVNESSRPLDVGMRIGKLASSAVLAVTTGIAVRPGPLTQDL